MTNALPSTARRRNPRGQGRLLRDQLIDAATRLLAELGSVESLTLRAVAREVGVAPASVYSHFADLDELVAHVMAEQYEELIGLTDLALASRSEPLARVAGRAWTYARWAVANPGYYRVLFGVRVTDPETHTPPAGRIAGVQLLDGLILDVRDCGGAAPRAAGDVPPSEADRLRGLLLWAGLHGVMSLHIDRPDVGWPDLDKLLTGLVALHLGRTEAEVEEHRPPEASRPKSPPAP